MINKDSTSDMILELWHTNREKSYAQIQRKQWEWKKQKKQTNYRKSGIINNRAEKNKRYRDY